MASKQGIIRYGFEKITHFVTDPYRAVFAVTSFFYGSLYFSIHNRTLLLLTLIFAGLLYWKTKQLSLSLFLVFVATLPFAKGKGFEIILLPKEYIQRYALYKISYFFPLYLSDFFLCLLGYWYLRKKIYEHYQVIVPRAVLLVLSAFFLFIGIILIKATNSLFWSVIILSSIQMVKMAVIMLAPFIIKVSKGGFQYFFSVLSASTLFQAIWVFLQRLHGGPLGKDIEVFLPGAELGIRSSENVSVLRATGTFFEPSILGTFLLMNILLLTVALFQQRLAKSLRNSAKLSILCGSVALVFTGSRALYILALLFSVFLIKQYFKRIRSALSILKKKYFALLVVFGCLAVVTPFILLRISSVADLFSFYGSGTYRLQMMVYSTRLALQQPFGVGINLSPYYLATAFNTEQFIFDPTYPHNQLFQILAETGLVGLVLWIVFIYLSFKAANNNKRWFTHNPFIWGAIVYLAAAQFYPIFLNHPEILGFLFLFLGLGIRYSKL